MQMEVIIFPGEIDKPLELSYQSILCFRQDFLLWTEKFVKRKFMFNMKNIL